MGNKSLAKHSVLSIEIKTVSEYVGALPSGRKGTGMRRRTSESRGILPLSNYTNPCWEAEGGTTRCTQLLQVPDRQGVVWGKDWRKQRLASGTAVAATPPARGHRLCSSPRKAFKGLIQRGVVRFDTKTACNVPTLLKVPITDIPSHY